VVDSEMLEVRNIQHIVGLPAVWTGTGKMEIAFC
jgi:hypothetical protein